VKNRLKTAFPYVAPFATWMILQMTLPPTAVAYAVRTVLAGLVGAACLFMAKRLGPAAPTSDRRRSTVLAGLVTGLLVYLLWVAPEYSLWYQTWLTLPLGTPPPPPTPSPYEPAVCGGLLTAVKLFGSAFVIAPAEEFFFRSYLYRRLQARDFRAVPLSRFDLSAFLWMTLLFTLEHNRPVVAALAAAFYGLLAIRRGIGAAVIAHVTTNLVLGLHVIYRQEWWFW
jgi:CAAX prenyl protease-like protein